MREVPSTLHQMMKFLTDEGVKIVYGEQHAAKEMFAIEEVAPIPKALTSEKSSNECKHATKYQSPPPASMESEQQVIEDKNDHVLAKHPRFKLVERKKRHQSGVKNGFIKDEVTKLIKIGSVREVKYPEWLANVVNLNRACPKDSSPLPNIDRMIDATTGHEILTYLNAYSEHNQI
ncbi:uncharacterized protein LOC142172454 [Nicotiana tabacum]|uniref:Uncharacterized protein LOC142172454 n=1 Tax=Nicotiana tabacum TaxID=4097 RepID=A0AC58T4L9_TOBAC